MAIYGMKVGSSGAEVDVNGHIWHEGYGLLVLRLM